MERFYVIHNTPIYLGRCGEKEAREVAFDISGWKSVYGDGVVQLMVKRSGEDDMYPVPLTVDGRWAIWTVTGADTAIPGRAGECELSYMPAESSIVKSETWATFVLPSMDGEAPDPPAGAEAYIDRLRAELAQQIVLAAEVAENAVTAVQAAEDARVAEVSARVVADRAVAVVNGVLPGAQQAAMQAEASASEAKNSEAIAVDAANRAQAEANRATIPAVSGVYNVILTDSVTGGRYALIVENGRLSLLGVSDTLDATNMNLIDSATGTAYELTVESGRLNLKEV